MLMEQLSTIKKVEKMHVKTLEEKTFVDPLHLQSFIKTLNATHTNQTYSNAIEKWQKIVPTKMM
jgi:hypothetical protein